MDLFQLPFVREKILKFAPLPLVIGWNSAVSAGTVDLEIGGSLGGLRVPADSTLR